MNHSFAQALGNALTYAVVSHEVSRAHNPVQFLYRESPAFEKDSGWRIFGGDETDEYVNNSDNFDLLHLSQILDSNPELSAVLRETEGAWEWNDDAQTFTAVADWQPKD